MASTKLTGRLLNGIYAKNDVNARVMSDLNAWNEPVGE